MKFSIEQLKQANNACTLADFYRLLKKYLPEEDQADPVDFRHRLEYYGEVFNNSPGILRWIFGCTLEVDKETHWGETYDKMIADLLAIDLEGPELLTMNHTQLLAICEDVVVQVDKKPYFTRQRTIYGDTVVELGKVLDKEHRKGWKVVAGTVKRQDNRFSCLIEKSL